MLERLVAGIHSVRGNSKGIDRIRKDWKAKNAKALPKSVRPEEKIARNLSLDNGIMLN